MSLGKIVEKFNSEQINKITSVRQIPDFRAGDTLKIKLIIKDSNSSRFQLFEGLCISKNNKGIGSNFTLRKASVHGSYVERTFFVYSPIIKEISVVKKGIVRRAKLYYIRELSSKAGRVKEKKTLVNSKKKNKN